MIIRPAQEKDAKIMHDLLSKEGIHTNKEFLTKSIKNSKKTIILENKEVQAFMLIRELHGLNEITHWRIKGKEAIKTIKKEIKEPLAVTENENNKERIKTLNELGFKKQATREGIYKNAKAVLLIKK